LRKPVGQPKRFVCHEFKRPNGNMTLKSISLRYQLIKTSREGKEEKQEQEEDADEDHQIETTTTTTTTIRRWIQKKKKNEK